MWRIPKDSIDKRVETNDFVSTLSFEYAMPLVCQNAIINGSCESASYCIANHFNLKLWLPL